MSLESHILAGVADFTTQSDIIMLACSLSSWLIHFLAAVETCTQTHILIGQKDEIATEFAVGAVCL